MSRPDRAQRIETVLAFGKALQQQSRDEQLIRRACTANPWFTAFFIRESIRRMQKWFDRELLDLLLRSQPTEPEKEQNIGIIMAGNLPFVGLHDLLVCLLAGHRALVRYSSKDSVLLQDLLHRVFSLTPSVKGRVRQFSPAKKLDFLLATGSDNTARYLDHHFREVPRIIRKNRFSVAVLTGKEQEKDLNGLCEDILLYNGFGCRNVGTVFLPEGVDLEFLVNAVSAWPVEKLSEPYRALVKRERATSHLLQKEIIDSPHLLIRELGEKVPAPSAPGYLHVHRFCSQEELSTQLENLQEQLQVIVGRDREIGLGETQSPAFFDFADGLNTLAILSQPDFSAHLSKGA